MLLLDQNISYKVAKLLAEDFPNILHISNAGLYNASDLEIWEFARLNKLAIVTFDHDFLNISILKGCPPKIILIKTGNRKTSELVELLKSAKSSIIQFISDLQLSNVACLEIN